VESHLGLGALCHVSGVGLVSGVVVETETASFSLPSIKERK
jgi:hypothetical protein